MAEHRYLTVAVPPGTPLSEDFEERLGDLMAPAFGPAWPLEEWYEVDEPLDNQVFAFVFVPDHRTKQQRLDEYAERASQVLTEALPEINRAIMEGS